MIRNGVTIPDSVLELVRVALQPFDDGGREIEGIPDEDGCLRCVLPLLDGIGRLFLTRTRLGRTVRISVKVGAVLYRNLRPHLKRMGMRLRLRWRERRAEG
jgi:hypothetical protein